MIRKMSNAVIAASAAAIFWRGEWGIHPQTVFLCPVFSLGV